MRAPSLTTLASTLLVLVACNQSRGEDPQASAEAFGGGDVPESDAAAPAPAGDGAGEPEPDPGEPESPQPEPESPATTCPPISPSAQTDAADSCPLEPSEVIEAAALEGIVALDVALQDSEVGCVVAATAEAIHVVVFEGMVPLAPMSWELDGELEGGPYVAATDDLGYAITWGDGAGLRYARPGEEPVTLSPGAPRSLIAGFAGTRLLAETSGVLEIVSVDLDGTETARHFVNGSASIARLWTHNEGDQIVMPYVTTDAEGPLFYQTSSVTGGQCSLPAPYGFEVGEGGSVTATGLSYGLSLVAWVEPKGEGCTEDRLRIMSYLETFLDVPSPLPFEAEVQILGAGPLAVVAEVATLEATGPDEPGGFELIGQFVDLQHQELGATIPAWTLEGSAPPTHWELARDRGKYLLAWADPSGLRLRRFCF